MSKFEKVKIKQRSGFDVASHKAIPPLKKEKVHLSKDMVGGDAPKNVIHVYEYGEAKVGNKNKWPTYIAKLGHKSYPTESITEQLITRVGQILEFNMAESKLRRLDNQIRFLSRNFRKEDERLVHGAEIFAAHLEDESFVLEVEGEKKSPSIFHFGYVCEAIEAVFPDDCPEIINEFVRLLAFDAIVGNNDRHHYNWGVLTNIRGAKKPRFSPIYDTARALFWNLTEAKLRKCVCHPKTGEIHPPKSRLYLESYLKKTRPWTGWKGSERIEHFQLISLIVAEYPEFGDNLPVYSIKKTFAALENLVSIEFDGLLSEVRSRLILDYLLLRLELYNEAVKGGKHD